MGQWQSQACDLETGNSEGKGRLCVNFIVQRRAFVFILRLGDKNNE